MQQKRIVILGAGESGTGAAVLAKLKGFDVFVSDKGKVANNYADILNEHKIEWEQENHTIEKILDANEIIKSPGIPNTVPVIKEIIKNKIKIISEIEFASRYTSAVKICVTGSNGKTTTTSMIYNIMQKANLNVGIAGNIGKSFAYQVAYKKHDYYVLELSSFQLDNMYDFKADLALLMNITPDHLDRYEYEFQNYINSKFRITRNQTKDDFFIYCSDDKVVLDELNKYDLPATKLPFSVKKTEKIGAHVSNDKINFNINNDNFTMLLQDLSLPGIHNTYNSMAAGIASKVLDIRNDDIRESLGDFKNIEHRLEPVLKINKIQFINDSKATNVNSTWYALESMNNQTVWIAGGVDKGNDYDIIKDLVEEKVKAIICLGKDNTKLHKAFGDTVEMYDATSIKDAVRKAYALAKTAENVLLSPACASFDFFDNYEDRGHQFKMAVREL